MSSALADHLEIGRLSIESDTPIKTIRYYEESGLIRSDNRTEGQFRLFRSDTVNRSLFIKRSHPIRIVNLSNSLFKWILAFISAD